MESAPLRGLLLGVLLCFALANGLYVSNSGVDSPTCGTEISPCLTIGGAINNAVSGDTIYLVEPGPFNGTGNVNLTIALNKTLTIASANDTRSVIFCGGLRFLSVSMDPTTTLTLSKLAVQNCAGNGNGGAIFANGGVLNIQNSSFTQNTVVAPGTRYGGAVYFTSNRSINIVDSDFTSNTASSGGAFATNGATVTITNCRFLSNRATGLGGALFFLPSNPVQVIANSVFISNIGNSGAAVYSESDVNCTGSTFTNNTASGNQAEGGAWSLYRGFSAQSNCTYEGNFAPGGGGVYYLDSGAGASCTGCLFRRNSGGAGGVVYAQSAGFTAVNSQFLNNDAAQQGGAGCFVASRFTLNYVTISGNTAGKGGGVNVQDGSTGFITGGVISGNTAIEGKGIYCANSKITINGLSLQDDFFCAAFPVLTRCKTEGEGQWADYCPALDSPSGTSSGTAIIIGVVVGVGGALIIIVLLAAGALYMKRNKYWLWSEVTTEE